MLEETAWEFIPQTIVGIYMYPNQHSDITYLRVCFSGTCENHHPEQALDTGIIQAVWLSEEEIKEKMAKCAVKWSQNALTTTLQEKAMRWNYCIIFYQKKLLHLNNRPI